MVLICIFLVTDLEHLFICQWKDISQFDIIFSEVFIQIFCLFLDCLMMELLRIQMIILFCSPPFNSYNSIKKFSFISCYITLMYNLYKQQDKYLVLFSHCLPVLQTMIRFLSIVQKGPLSFLMWLLLWPYGLWHVLGISATTALFFDDSVSWRPFNLVPSLSDMITVVFESFTLRYDKVFWLSFICVLIAR